MTNNVLSSANQSPSESDLEAQVALWLQNFQNTPPVVVVPIYNAYEDVIECLESLLKFTPSHIPIIALDDASPDPRIAQNLPVFSTDNRYLYLRKSNNTGFVGAVNCAFAWFKPHDVVIVNSDIVVPENWLERLKSAAYFRSNIATATPLTNHGTIVSLPYPNQPVNDLIEGMSLAEMDKRIREKSLQLYPVLPTAIGHCVYFKRTALDVVGYFDECFAPGYAEEVDFSQRAIINGFNHVLADDLFVYHKGSRSFAETEQETKRRLKAEHEAIVYKRYPWYISWVHHTVADLQSPLARAIERGQAALLGYRIAIDATCIGGPITGTQIHTLELIRAVALSPDRTAHLSIIIHEHIDRTRLQGVDQLVDEVVTLESLKSVTSPRFNLVHRHFQIANFSQLTLLSRIAQRIVVAQLDFIAYANPIYKLKAEDWLEYRSLTQVTFNYVDGIIFNSNDVVQEANLYGVGLESERTCIISPGVDHNFSAQKENVSPPQPDNLAEVPFILMLGTDFKHKNRAYALKLTHELISKYNWSGKLIIAGPNATEGGSAQEEAELIAQNPVLQNHVKYLGSVSESEKLWLLQNACLLLYPSTVEGFGLVPFEAASAGTPALTSQATALNEALGDDIIYLPSFNPEHGADLAWSLISDKEKAKKQVVAIQERRNIYSWAIVAKQTWAFYDRILTYPPRSHREDIRRLFEQNPREFFSLNRKPVSAWRRQLALAVYVTLINGFGSLLNEIKGYFKWFFQKGKNR